VSFDGREQMQSRITSSIDARASHKVRAIMLVALLGYCAGAHCADSTTDSGPSMFSLNGFGTLGVVHSSEENADFVGNFFQPKGAGFTRAWSPTVDSKLGLQVDTRFNDQFSVVVQVTSQLQYDDSYTPSIEWANIKYQITPDISVRVGRTVSSLFMVSDSSLVGYTYPWVRPPLEVYAELPINHKDGIDASYGFRVGEVTSVVKASYGQFTSKVVGGGAAKATHFFDMVESLEYGPSTLRFGYSSLRVDIEGAPGLDALFGGFTQFGNTVSVIPGLQAIGAQALSVARTYPVSETPYSLMTVGAKYDPGTWLLMAEWVKANGSRSFSNAAAWYVTGGYRINKVTPFVTLSEAKSDTASKTGISTTGLPPALAGAATALNGGLTAVINSFAFTQKDLSAGVRWDFMRGTDLKLQYDHLLPGAGSYGPLINVQPGFRSSDSANLFSATVDFVF
jgi:hypothetical protein